MRYPPVMLVVLGVLLAGGAGAQEVVRYRAAVVALTDDAELRAEFERRLVAKAVANNYDAVTSYDLEADVEDLSDPRFVELLRTHGIQAVLMLRPAAIGAGSSIESVREEVSPRVFSRMREFATAVSSTGPDDLLAVVHMGVYTIDAQGAHLISAGAVWLDEEVEDRDEGIERLQDLIVYNINSVRPAIRRHLGLPPLP